MKKRQTLWLFLTLILLLAISGTALSQEETPDWTPLPVTEDPLVRMPGTQPGHVTNLEAASVCTSCHSFGQEAIEPVFNWRGSMMAQSARDFMFWATLVVAAQDSVHVLGNPNAVDLCERCHFPKGWLEGRSDPPNASAMTGADYDGVQCSFCHRMWDPHFEDTYNGTREGNDWAGYWDEATAVSATAAATTRTADIAQTSSIRQFFNNAPFFSNNRPISPTYTEAASGQYYVSNIDNRRASFADANANHNIAYSRFHKSKYFCASCHDVSNPVLANLENEGSGLLPSEAMSASSYFHVERTFSEFMLSAYGQQGGAAGIGPYAPAVFNTSTANNYISRCQDCHMPDGVGKAASQGGAILRPTNSTAHPNSGQPVHDLTGGNVWVSRILASAITGSANYDVTNFNLLRQGPNILTLDLTQGTGLSAPELLAGANRAAQQLEKAATIEAISYDLGANTLAFRIQNQTGHKLISGFPEGRRMFINIRAYDGNNALLYEVNPYDSAAATLKGLNYPYQSGFDIPAPAALSATEIYMDELVYEMKPSSTITGEGTTFHFVLGTGRYKDNRIPPMGFDIDGAAARLSEPVWQGVARTDYFTAEEYAGGYDEVSLYIPPGAARIEVGLYYQTTSREYVEFLRDEINGNPNNRTLPAAAYIAQTDPFFAKLKAWGNTVWQLWRHNRNAPGGAPYLMAEAELQPCIYSAQSGAWGAAATWGGGIAPLATSGVCIKSGHTVTLNANTAVDQLWIAPGGTLDLGVHTLTAEKVVRNDGLLRQTRPVNSANVEFLHIQNSAKTATLYRGVMLDSSVNGGNNLGNVTAAVRELNDGEYCTSTGGSSPNYTRRCYSIVPDAQPTTGVTVRLYARASDELNEVPADRLLVYRNTPAGSGNWVALVNPIRGTVGDYRYSQGETTGFSAFLLGDERPTAVSLSALGSMALTRGYGLTAVVLVGLLLVTAVIATRSARKTR
jgi:hypothetical protein